LNGVVYVLDMKNAEMHVFHRGTQKEYSTFLSQNRHRVFQTDVASDRVIVWCVPEAGSDNQVFLTGNFPSTKV